MSGEPRVTPRGYRGGMAMIEDPTATDTRTIGGVPLTPKADLKIATPPTFTDVGPDHP